MPLHNLMVQAHLNTAHNWSHHTSGGFCKAEKSAKESNQNVLRIPSYNERSQCFLNLENSLDMLDKPNQPMQPHQKGTCWMQQGKNQEASDLPKGIHSYPTAPALQLASHNCCRCFTSWSQGEVWKSAKLQIAALAYSSCFGIIVVACFTSTVDCNCFTRKF